METAVEVQFVSEKTWRRKVRAWRRDQPPRVRRLGTPRENPLPPNAFQAAEVLIRRGQQQAALKRY